MVIGEQRIELAAVEHEPEILQHLRYIAADVPQQLNRQILVAKVVGRIADVQPLAKQPFVDVGGDPLIEGRVHEAQVVGTVVIAFAELDEDVVAKVVEDVVFEIGSNVTARYLLQEAERLSNLRIRQTPRVPVVAIVDHVVDVDHGAADHGAFQVHRYDRCVLVTRLYGEADDRYDLAASVLAGQVHLVVGELGEHAEELLQPLVHCLGRRLQGGRGAVVVPGEAETARYAVVQVEYVELAIPSEFSPMHRSVLVDVVGAVLLEQAHQYAGARLALQPDDQRRSGRIRLAVEEPEEEESPVALVYGQVAGVVGRAAKQWHHGAGILAAIPVVRVEHRCAAWGHYRSFTFCVLHASLVLFFLLAARLVFVLRLESVGGRIVVVVVDILVVGRPFEFVVALRPVVVNVVFVVFDVVCGVEVVGMCAEIVVSCGRIGECVPGRRFCVFDYLDWSDIDDHRCAQMTDRERNGEFCVHFLQHIFD